jgi:hypothetical protein
MHRPQGLLHADEACHFALALQGFLASCDAKCHKSGSKFAKTASRDSKIDKNNREFVDFAHLNAKGRRSCAALDGHNMT